MGSLYKASRFCVGLTFSIGFSWYVIEQNIIPHITADQVSMLIVDPSDDVLLSNDTLQNTNPTLQGLHFIIKWLDLCRICRNCRFKSRGFPRNIMYRCKNFIPFSSYLIKCFPQFCLGYLKIVMNLHHSFQKITVRQILKIYWLKYFSCISVIIRSYVDSAIPFVLRSFCNIINGAIPPVVYIKMIITTVLFLQILFLYFH